MMLDLPNHLKKPRLRRQHASEYLDHRHGLQFSPATLAKYACQGKGPAYNKVNRTPFYAVEELDRWARQMLGDEVNSTSEYQ